MRTAVVVPCYNEEKRLRLGEFAPLLERGELYFVDNGSADGTAALLAAYCAKERRAHLLSLASVGGKAEAVRFGLREARAHGAEIAGFLDADLATPAAEMCRVLDAVEDGAQAALGSRVGIPRPLFRLVLGRIFARLASAVLGLPIQDTQCGAKAFLGTEALDRALATPFAARWAFDVELLGRLLAAGAPPRSIREVRLREWHEVPGSKLRPADFPRMGLELWRVRRALKKLQSADGAAPGRR
jgi:glycosyltransferase involved in cell wall biosynthesis